MNIPAKFQLNRTTNAYQSELLIKALQKFNMLFSTFVGPVQTAIPETHFVLHKALFGLPTNLSEHPASFTPKT
jgi:hypothetical protein